MTQSSVSPAQAGGAADPVPGALARLELDRDDPLGRLALVVGILERWNNLLSGREQPHIAAGCVTDDVIVLAQKAIHVILADWLMDPTIVIWLADALQGLAQARCGQTDAASAIRRALTRVRTAEPTARRVHWSAVAEAHWS